MEPNLQNTKKVPSSLYAINEKVQYLTLIKHNCYSLDKNNFI